VAAGACRAELPVPSRKLRMLARETAFSEYPGHARRLASAATDYSGVICVGGDGTLLEIINGIDSRRQTVAIVPTGRGNSLARDLGLYPLVAAIEAIQTGERSAIDVAQTVLTGVAGPQIELTSASTVALGYPVAATILANRLRLLGRFCYAAAAIVAAATAKSMTIEVAYDGGERTLKRLTGLIINNTRHVANFLAFPAADCADGHLDVMELNSGFLRQNLHNLSALSATNFYAPVAIQPARNIELRLPEPAQVIIDGEIYRNVSVLNVRVSERALECVRPRRLP